METRRGGSDVELWTFFAENPQHKFHPPDPPAKTMEKKTKAVVETAEQRMEQLPRILASRIRPHMPMVADAVGALIVDAPITLIFSLACVLVHTLDTILVGQHFAPTFFAVPPFRLFSFTNPLSYFRLFSHVLGHGSWSHLHGNASWVVLVVVVVSDLASRVPPLELLMEVAMPIAGNMVNTLLVAPACEREYGAFALVKVGPAFPTQGRGVPPVVDSFVLPPSARIHHGLVAHATDYGLDGLCISSGSHAPRECQRLSGATHRLLRRGWPRFLCSSSLLAATDTCGHVVVRPA